MGVDGSICISFLSAGVGVDGGIGTSFLSAGFCAVVVLIKGVGPSMVITEGVECLMFCSTFFSVGLAEAHFLQAVFSVFFFVCSSNHSSHFLFFSFISFTSFVQT